MAKLVFDGITVEAEEITPEIKRALAFSILVSKKHSGKFPPELPDISEQEINAVIAEIDTQETAEQVAEQSAADFRRLPDWATWTGAEAAEALRTGILAGMTKTEARAAIDSRFAGVTNLAQLGAATVAILKQLADAVIDSRDIGHQNEARAILYLRDVVIR